MEEVRDLLSFLKPNATAEHLRSSVKFMRGYADASSGALTVRDFSDALAELQGIRQLPPSAELLQAAQVEQYFKEDGGTGYRVQAAGEQNAKEDGNERSVRRRQRSCSSSVESSQERQLQVKEATQDFFRKGLSSAGTVAVAVAVASGQTNPNPNRDTNLEPDNTQRVEVAMAPASAQMAPVELASSQTAPAADMPAKRRRRKVVPKTTAAGEVLQQIPAEVP